MKFKLLAVAAALAVAGPAFSKTVNITDFSFVGPVVANVVGGPISPSQTVDSGQLTGLLDGVSFKTYCAELDQDVFPGLNYDYDQLNPIGFFSAAKVDALNRLFTVAASFVVDADTSGAVQAAVWEIIYETGSSYSLSGGSLKVSAAPGDVGALAAFSAMDGILGNLGSITPTVSVNFLHSDSSQDFFYVPEVPEPGTWALMFAGLGVLGAVARRRKAA